LKWPCFVIAAAPIAAASWACVAAEKSASPGAIRYGRPRALCVLASRKVNESSGVACSRRRPGVFWTHNDSGDDARLFAFDRKGRHLGQYNLPGAENVDWEDLASFTLDGKHYLLICDTGDNERYKKLVTLYIAEEPLVDPNKPAQKGKLRLTQTIHFTYDDGPQDCEAVAIDPTTRAILLISKRGKRTVYELPIPRQAVTKKLVARSIGRLNLWPVVAMDISPDGRRAVALTYLHAYEYVRAAGEKWAAAFARPARTIPMPVRRQGESICYGPRGRSLYLTSEKLPTPLLEVPALPAKPAAPKPK
jgi:hypothetical protein